MNGVIGKIFCIQEGQPGPLRPKLNKKFTLKTWPKWYLEC